jgi:hypothetical protein
VYLVIVFLSMILPMLLLSSKLKRNLIVALKLTISTSTSGWRTITNVARELVPTPWGHIPYISPHLELKCSMTNSPFGRGHGGFPPHPLYFSYQKHGGPSMVSRLIYTPYIQTNTHEAHILQEKHRFASTTFRP